MQERRRGRPRDARAGMKGTQSSARRGEGLGRREGGREIGREREEIKTVHDVLCRKGRERVRIRRGGRGWRGMWGEG